jgi:hypothetical protein
MPAPKRRKTDNRSRLAQNVAANPWKWLLGIAGAVGVLATAFTSSLDMWGRVDGHWQTKDAALRHEQDDDMKNKAQDTRVDRLSAWSRYGTTSLRADFMRDRVYDCAARKATAQKMPVADAAICQRYEAEFKEAFDRAEELRKRLGGAAP